MNKEAMKLPPYLNASYEGDDLFTGDQVRELLAKQEQGEPKQEDYLSKAYRLANELRCHLAIAPAPQQRTWVGLTWHDVPNEWVGNVSFMEGAKWAEAKFKEKNG